MKRHHRTSRAGKLIGEGDCNSGEERGSGSETILWRFDAYEAPPAQQNSTEADGMSGLEDVTTTT